MMKRGYIFGGIIVLLLIFTAVYFKSISPAPSPSPGVSPSPGSTDIAPTTNVTPGTGSAPGSAKPSAGGGAARTASKTPFAGSGRILFAVTDAAADLGSIRSIILTVTDVKIHSPVKKWITIPGGGREFDLLELKKSGSLGLLADAYLESETYNQLWFAVSDVSIVKFDGTAAKAKIPSGTIRFPASTRISRGETTVVAFDFEADTSLHTATDGTYVFLPVITVSVQNPVNAAVRGGNVSVVSGASPVRTVLGMDENGDIVENFALHRLTNIEFLGNVIKLRPYDAPESTLRTSASRALEIATGGKYVDTVMSIKLLDGTRWRISGTKGSSRVAVDVSIESGAVIGR